MKRLLANIAFWALPLIASAQRTTLLETSLFFQSGQHELDAASTARLDSIARILRTQSDFEVELRAYTDDIGSQASNLRLAENRSASVRAFLEKQRISAQQQRIANVGERPLAPGETIENQRRQNRRVDLIVTVPQFDDLGDVHSFFVRKANQEIRVTNERGTAFITEKGTRFFIPSKAFVYKDGRPVTDSVTLVVREVYSVADIILQNTPTQSQGQLLETGGTFYIGAFDENGTELALGLDKQIVVSFASEAALKDGMQIFTADRPFHDEENPTDWHATGNQILRPALRTNAEPTVCINASCLRKSVNELLALRGKGFGLPKIEEPQMIEEVAQPQVPQRPMQFVPKKWTREELIAANPRKYQESEKGYEERMRMLYQYEKGRHKRSMKFYEDHMPQYLQDSATYNDRKAAYLAYESAVNEQLKMWGVERQRFLRTFPRASQSTLLDKANELADQLWVMHTRYNGQVERAKYLILLGEKLKQPQFRAELERIAKTSPIKGNPIMQDTSFAHQMKVLRQSYKVRDLLSYFEMLDRNKTLSSEPVSVREVSLIQEYNKICAQFADEKALQRYIDKIIAAEKMYEPYAEQFDATQAALTRIYESLLVEKERQGYLEPQEVAQLYTNGVGIDKMGWINCDRFNQNTSPRVELVAQMQGAEYKEVQGFVVFKNINSVMSMQRSVNQLSVGGVPANEQVSVVLIRIQGLDVEVAVQKGRAGQLKNIAPTFQKIQPSELRKYLDAV